jgi:hypothetical protein
MEGGTVAKKSKQVELVPTPKGQALAHLGDQTPARRSGPTPEELTKLEKFEARRLKRKQKASERRRRNRREAQRIKQMVSAAAAPRFQPVIGGMPEAAGDANQGVPSVEKVMKSPVRDELVMKSPAQSTSPATPDVSISGLRIGEVQMNESPVPSEKEQELLADSPKKQTETE